MHRSEEIADLGDKIEGAQDELRNTYAMTRSEISAMTSEAKGRRDSLNSEIAELERQLADARREVAGAVRERDRVKNSIRDDERKARAASQKELSQAKRGASEEKRKLTRDDRYALEARIEQAESDLSPAMEELQAERRQFKLPQIASLKDKLQEMKDKMLPQVEELKEKRLANEMFFDQSWKQVKKDKKVEIEFAKSTYEKEVAAEEEAQKEAVSRYISEIEAKEEELARDAELSSQPVESTPDVLGAMEEARKKMMDLIQEKSDAIAKQKEERVGSVNDAVESQSALQDRYDAEYENEKRKLGEQERRGKRKLEEEDARRDKRRVQLEREMDHVKARLAALMREERTAAEEEYAQLQRTKTAELTGLASTSKGVSNEIETVKSNLTVVQYETRNLQRTLREKQVALDELEEERGSFRKQARRTLSIAVDRIRRKK